MKIRLFPGRFLNEDACFHLFRQEDHGALDLPVTIEGDSGLPFHVVHSDPDQLAFLAGLILLQSWVYGLDELELPATERRPLLIVTDTPGRFSEAYLRLQIPTESIRSLSRRRGAALYQKLGIVKNIKEKSEFWNYYVKPGERRTRLHNFFPAYQVLGPDSPLYLIASREHLGRGDTAGPALVIMRNSGKGALGAYQKRFHPLLIIFDAHGLAVSNPGDTTPWLVYHESIFAPELTESDQEMILCSLPDTQFEQFCSHAKLQVVEPHEPPDLTKAWADVDSGLMALAEYVAGQRDEITLEVYRLAARLRSILLSLPVSIRAYEQALYGSGTPEETCASWSTKSLLRGLEHFGPAMSGMGQWEAMMVEELICGFRRLDSLLGEFSPKHDVVVASLHDSLDAGRSAALVASSDPLAGAIRWAMVLPPPVGLGLPPERVTAISARSIPELRADQDCIVHHAFDPHEVFSALAKVAPRSIMFVLLQNELRFIGERFSRIRDLLPEHSAHSTILASIHRHVERLPPTRLLRTPGSGTTLLADVHFRLAMKLFEARGLGVEYGTVLVDTDSDRGGDAMAEVPSCFLKLEGDNGVFLDLGSRVTCICRDDSVIGKQAMAIDPGDRLIIVSPEAREVIASRILGAKRVEEADTPADQAIRQWQYEISEGLTRTEITQSELLRRIQRLGSHRSTPAVIGQWLSGDVLGPLDARDIQRVGEALGSEWLLQNWERVGFALSLVRSGHRALGHRVTQIIQRAALGSLELTGNDHAFLEQLGITMAKLQDAVMVLAVREVVKDAGMIPIAEIGRVIPA